MEDSGDTGKSGWFKGGIAVAGGILVLLMAKGIGALIGRASVEQFESGYQESTRDAEIERGLRKVADDLRGQLPMQVDDITTVIGVAAVGKRISYAMRISEPIEPEGLTDLKAYAQQHTREGVCPGAQALFDAGATMQWHYSDATGNEFDVILNNC